MISGEGKSDSLSRSKIDADGRPRLAGVQLRVGFLLMPDFTLMALTGFIEALRLAGDELDHSRNLYCSWEVMAPRPKAIRSSSGLSVLPTSGLKPPESFDYIVVIGGRLESHDRTDPSIIDYLRAAADAGIPLVGACTGSFLLARAGLMDNHRCCVHQFHLSDFQSEFPDIETEPDHLFLVDRRRITSAGGASSIDLAMHLIQRHCGRARALKVACQLVFEEARAGNHPQARTAVDWSANVRNPIIRRALLVMQQNIGTTIPIPTIASTVGVNAKQLERLFLAQLNASPIKIYRQIRLERALWLIEHSVKSMSEIAYECGFSDASHFSRTCREVFGTSPKEIRETRLNRADNPTCSITGMLPDLLPA
ncbi:GlxA family transcriptional regulator [Sphingosinicella rhizophila]|uniref:GlxA family transcriptional regulator n=1 Tax=Sphingosinicella rhizophila TaxID=3050082 RepID=A0ABU3QB25_9SPHN|nr:GlxA family transcriptional regulator [Sphingosinicella sp. GR2756]MDT9600208.1 GlxA family transcriptional regulator [Sphingosinicella sp. GR2756]